MPIFQEQAMKIALDAAKFTLRGGEPAAQGDGDLPLAAGTSRCCRTRWSGGWSTRGYDPDFAQRCFDQIKGFGEYGFPESHAASFAHLVYVSSWLKWKYPAAFACGAAQLAADGLLRAGADRPRRARAWRRGARGRRESTATGTARLEDGALRLGLRQIDGLQREAAERLVARPALPDASRNCAAAGGVPVHAIQRLAAADAFRSMGLDRRAALWDSRALKQAPDLPLFAYAEARDEGIGKRARAASRRCRSPSMS